MQLWAVERGIIPRGQVRAAQQTRRSLQVRRESSATEQVILVFFSLSTAFGITIDKHILELQISFKINRDIILACVFFYRLKKKKLNNFIIIKFYKTKKQTVSLL